MNNVVNGSGGLRIENNGPVTNNENQKTTNHIYLHPGERSGELNAGCVRSAVCSRSIGSTLR